MRLRWSLLSAMLCMLLLLFVAKPISAQTTSLGAITGVVTDPTNAVVSDATVTIKDTATGQVQTSNTNDAGRYAFVNLRTGTYDINIFKQGFSKISIPSDVVEIGQVSTRNVILRVGADDKTVDVVTTGVELESDNATVGNQVPGLALNSLQIGRAHV